MNKKFLSKIISTLLILNLLLPYVAFADLQGIVTDLDITNRSSNDGADYSIEFDWTRPFPSGQADNNASGSDATNSHRATSYTLYYRNTTKSEEYGSAKKIDLDDKVTNKDDISSTSNMNYLFNPNYLEPGSIYSFYVDPTHKHMYDTTVNGVQTTVEGDANKTNDNIQEVLFLTDIQVEAEINSSNLTVTWDNPTYMGREIFTGYKIYYQKGGVEVGSIPDNPSVVVLSNDNELQKSGNKLTYTFEADNLEIGAVYAVKVEPMYNGSIVREMTSPKIIIENTVYKINFTSREYRNNDAYVNPALYIMQEGLDYVRLYWDSLASSNLDISKLEIYSSKSQTFEQSVLIGSLEGESAKRINYWLSDIPDSLTYYKFIIYYNDGTKLSTMDSNIVYFDPTIFEFDPYMPNILEVNVSQSNPKSINVFWEAFMRSAYTIEEEDAINAVVNKFVDKDLDYKIWITDDVSNYSQNAFQDNYIKNIDATTLIEEEYVVDEVTNEKTLVFNDTFTTYYDYVDGVSTLRAIEENKIYYIKVQATRHLSGDLSQPAYYAVYITPSTPIITNPLSINKPPFKVKTDINGVEEITETSITVEWSTNWFEIYDESTNEWYSKVGVDEYGNIIFGDGVDNLPTSKVLYLDNETLFGGDINDSTLKVRDMLVSMGMSRSDVDVLAVRHMDITNSSYEIHTTTYENMDKSNGYSSYLQTIKDDDTLWTSVIGEENGVRKLQHTVTTTNAPDTATLQPNTSYVIYFRNYIIENDEKIYSEHPIYATATTLKDRSDLIITPPAQIIQFVSSTYDTVTFRWEYSTEIEYELKISNKLSDYTNGGISINNDELQQQKDIRTEDGKTYIYYTVKNLFPETTYYAWIKATIGDKTSDWSTPENGTTKELSSPLKPRGVGIVSDEYLRAINIQNDTNYVTDDPSYLIYEWSRITEDDVNYGVNGITSVGTDEYFGIETYLTSYGAKFNNLKANTRYYFRVRTVLNAVRVDMGAAYYYSYEVELSDNPQFKDSISFLVPNHSLEVDGIDVLQIKSDWTSTLSIISGKTGEEYDGEIDPDQYPMPLDDFDITYDEENDILTYEFRSTGMDSSGNENHSVDQRFITSLQQKGYFDFIVDVTDYNGIYPSTRIVEVPSSIMNAFIDTKTSLTIVSNNMEVSILPETFQSENMLLNNNSKAIFEFNVDTKNYTLNVGESFLSIPHNFKATISDGDNVKNISMFNNDIEISLIPSNLYDEIDKNVNMYELQNDNFKMIQSNKSINGKYKAFTKVPNTYSLIAKSVANSQEIDDSLYNVSNNLIISDMNYYVPEYDITTTQFNNIIYAVAMDSQEIAMNDTLTQTAYNHLGKSALLVSGTYVTNEKGIHSLIKLYELKTGSRIMPTDVSNINNVSVEYIESIQKAYEVEMFEEAPNFKSNMTFGEFIYYIDVILSDS